MADGSGEHYDATLEEAVAAGLFHPNCAHDLSPYFPGISPEEVEVPLHRREQQMVERYGYDEAQKYAYEAQERQRAIERHIRHWKMREATSLDPIEQSRARKKVLHWQEEQRIHLGSAPYLPRKYDREATIGYRDMRTERTSRYAFVPPKAGSTGPISMSRQATYADIKSQMAQDLSEIQHITPKRVSVTGRVGDQSLTGIFQNARNELGSYVTYLAGDTTNLMHLYLNDLENLLRSSQEEFTSVRAKDMDAFVTDTVKKLVYQEVQSAHVSFTDHGIRHNVHNIQNQMKILDILEVQQGIEVTGRERLMAVAAMVNHDIGYTVPAVRYATEEMERVGATKFHPYFSEKILKEQKDLWDEDKIFTEYEYAKVLNVVRTHDYPILDPDDFLGFATTVADNTSLFYAEKLPSLFAYVPGGEESLLNMAYAAQSDDEVMFDLSKKALEEKIGNAPLHPNLQRDLRQALDTVSMVTPKFSMGVLAGEIEDIVPGVDGLVNIRIKFNEFDRLLQKNFDMGQKQLEKLLDDYGIDDLSATNYHIGKLAKGGSLVSIDVKGAPTTRLGSLIPATKANEEMNTILEQFSSVVKSTSDPAYSSHYDLVLDNGRFFKPKETPEGVKQGPMKQCFKNAAQLAMENRDYVYVEGFATVKELPGYPIAHAWVVDKDGNVIDNTWTTPGNSYFGIPFETDFLLETVTDTGYWGLIPEFPSKKYNPFKDGFGEGAILQEGPKVFSDHARRNVGLKLMEEHTKRAYLVSSENIEKAPEDPVERANFLREMKAEVDRAEKNIARLTAQMEELALDEYDLSEWDESPQMKEWKKDEMAPYKADFSQGDSFLSDLLRLRRFDRTPELIDQRDVAKLMRSGDYLELHRGVTDAKFAEQFKYGDLYAGVGIYGNGTYTYFPSPFSDVDVSAMVSEHSNHKKAGMMRMLLPKNANIIDYESLTKMQEKTKRKVRRDLIREKRKAKKTDDWGAVNRLNVFSEISKDTGRFATALGIDAYYVKDAAEMVILNRGKLKVVK